MVYTPIPIGSPNWGGPVNAAFTSQDARISALESSSSPLLAAQGFKAVPYDPAVASATFGLTSGTVFMTRVDLSAPGTLNGIVFAIATAGASLTAGQNLVGLYNAAGTRVAVSADQTTAFGSTGLIQAAFTAPYAAAAGPYYLAVLSVGTTPITVYRSVSAGAAAGLLNFGLTAATARFATGPTAQTSLPASVTMSSRTPAGTSIWLGAY